MNKYDNIDDILTLLRKTQGLPFVPSDSLKFEALVPGSIYGARCAACTWGVDAAA